LSDAAVTSTAPELAVAIVNWRTADLAIDCLRSIAEQIADVPSCRVFIVDNGSADGSAEKIAEALEANGWKSFATLLPLSHNGGFAAGNNAAIRAALANPLGRPKFVLLLNPDTVVRPRAFRILLDFMHANTGVGIAGGRSEFPDATPQVCCFRFPNLVGEFAFYLRLRLIGRLVESRMPGIPIPDSPLEIDWVSGAFMMVRTAVLEDIGLLDEGFFLYYEETDFILRAKRAGWSCWHVPQSRVVHLVGQSSGVTKHDRARRPLPAYWFQSRTRYYLVNHGRLYAALTDMLVCLSLVTWKMRRVLQRRTEVDPPHFLRDLLRHSAAFNLSTPQPRKIDP
jgi:N-acetylglucosaminyl-diphospho-decaprenol L-rhamnosyltransferase